MNILIMFAPAATLIIVAYLIERKYTQSSKSVE